MFSEVVLIQKSLLHRFESRIEHPCMQGHECNLFKNNSIMYGVLCIHSPGKRSMRIHKYSRNVVRRELLECLYYHIPCLLLVLPFNFI